MLDLVGEALQFFVHAAIMREPDSGRMAILGYGLWSTGRLGYNSLQVQGSSTQVMIAIFASQIRAIGVNNLANSSLFAAIFALIAQSWKTNLINLTDAELP